MARTRFPPDHGLASRMVGVMFLLGLLYVAFVGVLFAAGASSVIIVAVVGALVFGQLFLSDKIGLAAMGAKEVTPEQAPGLHAMIERLCIQADLPKPKIAVADTPMPNAFAMGRSQKAATVAATTGIMDLLSPAELEGVLAHELTHVANRDVLVMTLAASAGIIAGMSTRGAQYGAIFGGGGDRRGNNNNTNGIPVWLIALVLSLVVYAVSFFLTRLLSRYRELCADRSGAFLTQKPSALASALTKISGDVASIPSKDLREVQSMNAFFITPAISGMGLRTLTSTHPSLEQRLEQLAKVSAELGKPMDGGFSAPGYGR